MMPCVLLAVGLLAWSVIGNLLVGDTLYVTRNVVLGLLVLLLARRAGAGWDVLGLGGGTLRAGARWGVLAVLAVLAALALGVLFSERLPGIGLLLSDERAQVSSSALAWHALWRIPLGTAAFEEVVFRGALLGLLLQQAPPVRALAVASVVFGLWHVAPTIVTLQANDVAVASGRGVGAVAGAVLVTTVAGAALGVLRLGSGSLLAPVLAHWATNSGGLLAAAATGPGA